MPTWVLCLVVADWDDRGHLGDARQYECWHATTGAVVKTLTEQTARGYHVFFTAQVSARLAVLAAS